jgi:protein gp37
MLSDAHWAGPRKWNLDAERTGVMARTFCASMADVFEDHPQVAAPRARLWALIEETPWLAWQLLTKRIENVAGMVPWRSAWPPNVWIGTSVENQTYADTRIPDLLRLQHAAVRFLSCEPLLGPVDLEMCGWTPDYMEGPPGAGNPLTGEGSPAAGDPAEEYANRITGLTRLDWVIVGGESGSKRRREMDMDAARSLVAQCRSAGVPVFVKQDSGPAPGMQGRIPDDLWALKEFPPAYRPAGSPGSDAAHRIGVENLAAPLHGEDQ